MRQTSQALATETHCALTIGIGYTVAGTRHAIQLQACRAMIVTRMRHAHGNLYALCTQVAAGHPTRPFTSTYHLLEKRSLPLL